MVGRETLNLGFPGSNPGGAAILKKRYYMLFGIIVIIVGVIFYCELIWKAVVQGHRPYKYMKDFIMFMAIFNYAISFVFSSWGSVLFAVVLSLYSIVIYPKRYALITNEGSQDDTTGKTEK